MAIYLYAAVLYLIIVEAIRRLWSRLENRLTRHLRREDLPTKRTDPRPSRAVEVS
jgi:polar amino acid transport system permease protein